MSARYEDHADKLQQIILLAVDSGVDTFEKLAKELRHKFLDFEPLSFLDAIEQSLFQLYCNNLTTNRTSGLSYQLTEKGKIWVKLIKEE